MDGSSRLQEILDGAQVAPAVFALRPGYRALLLAVDCLRPSHSNASSDALLQRAEAAATARAATHLRREREGL